MSRVKKAMLATTAMALWAAASPAVAQTVAEPSDPEGQAVAGEERLVPLEARGASSERAGGEGSIRPFGGGILPNAGTIRGFAGPVMGTAGTIRAFQGDVEGSAGTIRAFAGTIRAFAGTIRAFTLDVNPATGRDANFWGTLAPRSGSLTASAGTIRAFTGELEAMAGTIRAFTGDLRSAAGTIRAFDQAPATYTAINASLRSLVDALRQTWGKSVTAQTGKSFDQAFAAPMLAKYGINLDDPRSLQGLNEVGYELFLLDWQDNLMLYSGQDSVDHWMKAVNWTPRLTQDLGSGKDSRIGLLDFTVTGEGASSVVMASGVSAVSGGHGSAVMSLMTAAHDGRGVMGIAPGASVVAYNPFDATYTAGWADITKGVANLVKNGATIVNMSLGVPGYTLHPGWNDVFQDDTLSKEARKRVFVLAAGNDGITQTQNIEWRADKNPNIIVVGSVDPSGKISEFSNRPGSVCLLKNGKCESSGDLLMNRFIVAPGEFLLVSDGAGGVTRMSGTSFATPLVSGTVALMHDRWPWLRDKPGATVSILLNSARDVGEPGVDPVYGRGMLDVAAALSPEDWNGLTFKVGTIGGKLEDLKVGALTSNQREQMIQNWEAGGFYVTVFDKTLDTYRDFAIPLSTKLAGQTVGTGMEQFNSYLTQRFYQWFRGGGTAGGKGGSTSGFTTARFTSAMPSVGGLAATVTATPRVYTPGLRQSGLPYDTGLELVSENRGVGFRFGTGHGAAELNGAGGFALRSDYEIGTGGANPFLGLASGGGYGAVDVALGERLTLSTGVSRQDAKRDLRFAGLDDVAALAGLDPYRATATTVTARYKASSWLSASMGYTLLDEGSGLLGMQSTDRHDFAGGTTTDSGTFGLDATVSPSLSLNASATFGRTRAGGRNIAVGDGGIVSSAYQAAVTKVGLFSGSDRARITLSQPLHIERGSVDIANVQVIDRQTGELGVVVRSLDISHRERRFVAEALYGTPVMGGKADLNLFGRANLKGEAGSMPAVVVGGSFSLGF